MTLITRKDIINRSARVKLELIKTNNENVFSGDDFLFFPRLPRKLVQLTRRRTEVSHELLRFPYSPLQLTKPHDTKAVCGREGS